MAPTTPILADIVAEAHRILQATEGAGILVRLLGGLAVRLHAESATHRSLNRPYADIDLMTTKAGGRHLDALMETLGYVPNRSFNVLNGNERLLFHDEANSRQVDFFVDRFVMCHSLPIAERLHVEPLTLPLAELLLTKLQIVQMNEKDVRDVCALLLDHHVGSGDQETINVDRIAELCANDWGLYKTVTLSLRKISDFIDAFGLAAEERALILGRASAITDAIQATPKPLKWKLRDRIGERVQWYDLPEEVQRG
jgi:hypothetical protein